MAPEFCEGRAGDGEWEALEARSAQFSVGQEHIEVLEIRALAQQRRGQLVEARAQLERALAAASRIPNVMMARLRRELADYFDAASLQQRKPSS